MTAVGDLAAPSFGGRPSSQLSATKVGVVTAFGAVLWLVGIFLIRWIGGAGALSNAMTPIVFALIVVATIPFIWLAPRAVGLPKAFRMHCGAIMGATAALLDGVAVRWTHWYATDPRLLADSAATLLWAIGVAVGLGVAMSVLGEGGHGSQAIH